jgi:hypothetical protein
MKLSELGYYPDSSVLRIDDISVNTNFEQLNNLLNLVRNKLYNLEILLAVSPMVFDMSNKTNGEPTQNSQRVFPKILNAYSDHLVFYNVDRIGIPKWLPEISEKFNCKIASHGLVHVDHRLMDFGAQELSIITSASLTQSNIFVPPFNKYNTETEKICENNGIKLVKWEDGWKHLGYHQFKIDKNKYYMHLHDFSEAELISFFS